MTTDETRVQAGRINKEDRRRGEQERKTEGNVHRRDTEEAKRKTEQKNVNHGWARMNTDKETGKEREQEEATTGIRNRH